MKKTLTTITLLLAIITSYNLCAQSPPPPPPNHGQTGNQNGGNAPMGSGLFILLGLGIVYGGRKIYNTRKENLEE